MAQANPDGTCNYDAGGDCSAGITEYKTQYVDPFVKVLKEFDGKVPVVLIIEPDSIPNLSTNQVCLYECGSESPLLIASLVD